MFVLRLLVIAITLLPALRDSRALDMDWAIDKNDKLAYL